MAASRGSSVALLPRVPLVPNRKNRFRSTHDVIDIGTNPGDERFPLDTVLDGLELSGVDHGLQVAGDPLASLGALRRLTASVARLVARV